MRLVLLKDRKLPQAYCFQFHEEFTQRFLTPGGRRGGIFTLHRWQKYCVPTTCCICSSKLCLLFKQNLHKGMHSEVLFLYLDRIFFFLFVAPQLSILEANFFFDFALPLPETLGASLPYRSIGLQDNFNGLFKNLFPQWFYSAGNDFRTVVKCRVGA